MREFKCQKCGKLLCGVTNLSENYGMSAQAGNYRCEKCRKSYLGTLVTKEKKCLFCSKNIKILYSLYSDEQFNLREVYLCPKCFKSYYLLKKLKE